MVLEQFFCWSPGLRVTVRHMVMMSKDHLWSFWLGLWVNVSLCDSGSCPGKWRAVHICIVSSFPLSWQLEDSVRSVRSGDGASGITGVFSCGCLCSARLSCCLFCFHFTRTIQPFDNIQSLTQYNCFFKQNIFFLLNSGWNMYFFEDSISSALILFYFIKSTVKPDKQFGVF